MEDYNQKSWFSKNWPWVLPLGCCSGCLVMFVVFVLGSGVALFNVMDEVIEMSPVEEIVTKAENNPKVITLIGENIEASGFPNGNIAMQNGDGDVDFSIDVRGSKGEGTLYATGIRANEKWVFEELYIIVKETGEQINLLGNEIIPEQI